MSVNENPHPSPLPLAGEGGGAQRRRVRALPLNLPLRRYGTTAAIVAGGLLALEAVGFIATVYFGPELLKAAEAAGVAGLLKP